MQILAHRGWWLQPPEKNTLGALAKAFAAGFGVETDLRDSGQALVISHDPPPTPALAASALFEQWRQAGAPGPLALNIKADGLAGWLQPLLERFGVANYFCFDMSVPETLVYRRAGLRYFARESEFERSPALYADAAGVWLDMFESDWVTAEDILRHARAGKAVALVSPELHRRPHRAYWETLKRLDPAAARDLLLCTDFPLEARAFFASTGDRSPLPLSP